MTRVLYGLLILLKIILYSKYESRHKRRHEGYMRANIRPSQISSSYSSINAVKSTFSEMTSVGHLRRRLPMTRDSFELLILLKIVLYSMYESRS